MENIKVRVKRINDAKMPEYATDFDVRGNSGADLFSTMAVKIYPMGRIVIPTDLFVEVPLGVDMQIRPKSGLALKHGIIVLNTPGTIDPSFRGNVGVILINLGDKAYTVGKGDKIAQAVFSPCLHAEFIDIDEELSKTKRGEGGYGSTGLK